MAEIATVARPYAEAAFKAALERNSLGAVSEALAYVAATAADPQMRSVLSNPKVTAQQKKDLFGAVVGARLDETTGSLLSILIDGHRDSLIGSIAEQFDELKRDHERVVVARITSAQPLSDQQRTDIVAALEK